MNERSYRTPATVAELRQLSPNDPAVLALEQPLPEAEALPPPPVGSSRSWLDQGSSELSDIIRPVYSPREANEKLAAAAAARAAGSSIEARLQALEAELAQMRRRRFPLARLFRWFRLQLRRARG